MSIHRMSEMEVERIIAILDDTMEKLSFLGSIAPEVLEHRDELSKFIGEEISRTMSEQKEMEREYDRLIERRAELKGMANKNKYKDVQERVNEISRGLKESTSKLVASLKENPNVKGNMIKVDKDRKEIQDLFQRASQELRDKGSFNVLMTKVDEEDAAIKRLLHLHAKDVELSEAISRLEVEVKGLTDTFQRSSRERKDTIISLKEEIHRMKSSTSTNTQFKKRESLAKVASVVREMKLQERVLELKVKDLQEQIQTEQTVNSETRSFLIRKQQQIIDDTNQWEIRFEAESHEKEKALRQILQQRDALVEKLTALQERKRQEEADRKAREDQDIADKDILKRRGEIARRKMAAAGVIYKVLKMYIQRTREAAKSDGKKKKKSKGEGKKKK